MLGAVRSEDGKRIPQQMRWGLGRKTSRWASLQSTHGRSCAIITCPPNALIGTLCDRMPVILAEEDWATWLAEEPATLEELKALLVPYRDDALTMWPVNRQTIGNVRNKDREVALQEPLS